MASLSYGSYGTKVRELQESLNKLPPTSLAPLAVDGIFGPKTLARVKEFQANNKLAIDGIVGPLTWGVIHELLKLLGSAQPPAPAGGISVRPITKQILGVDTTNNLIQQYIPPVNVIDVPTFRAGDQNNVFKFTATPLRTARLGIFAARKDTSPERAIILVLPGSGVPERVIIGISHRFSQAVGYYDALGWGDPLSPPLINDVLLRHVIKRWAAQVLSTRYPTALLHIVRAKGNELGPFAADGAFVRGVLEALVDLTANAFSFQRVEAFTYSNGIDDFNPFLQAINGHLAVAAVYNQDPAKAGQAARLPGVVVKQFLSGQTGGPAPGFEFMPVNRWQNELFFYQSKVLGPLVYLHGHCMPQYTLHLGMQLV